MLIIIILAGLLIASCSAMQTLAPSAQPTTKPLPAEARTILVGFSIMQIFGHILWSIIVALVGVVGFNIFNAYMKYEWIFQRNEKEKHQTSPEDSSDNLTEKVRIYTWLKLTLVTLLVGALIFVLRSVPGIIVTVPPDKIGVLIHLGKEQKTELESGTHLIVPYLEQVALISTREFTYIATSHVEDASEDFTDYKVGARTCDGVAVKLP